MSLPEISTTSSLYGCLSADKKTKLAEGITRVHYEITGAPSYFLQAVFNEVPEGNYFVGGKALTDFLICIWRINTSQHKKER